MVQKYATTPLTSAFTRIFLIDGGARPDHKPEYEACMRMQGLSQGFGDIERIECPDPFNWGKFVEVAQIRGATERPTTTLEGRYFIDALSTLMDLARKGCSFDVQLHMGECTDPSSFNTFKKSVVLESAQLVNYATDELGALSSGDNSEVNETADLSAMDMFEIFPLSMTEQAGSAVTNEVIDVTICDSISCGECEDQSDGCQKIFGLTIAAGGSVSTPADVVYSLNGGTNWYTHDVDTLGPAEEPNALACIGLYLVVVSNETDSIHYSLLSEYGTPGVVDWTEQTTGIVAAGSPNDIWSAGNSAFIVGDGGYVYKTDDPTAGVEILSAGSATTDDLQAVHGLSEFFAVAVGDNGAVIYTTDGDTWGATGSTPVGAAVTLNGVAVRGENDWIVVTDGGEMYFTLDQGTTWTVKAFPGSGSGVCRDIVFASQSVGYLSHDTSANRGRILRTYDGGYSWQVLPEGSGSLPLNDAINALAACESDHNFVVGVGLADNAADGIVVIGAA